jgi:hypothetical protein
MRPLGGRIAAPTVSVPSLTPRRLAWLLLWTSLVVHGAIAVVATFDHNLANGDFENYYDIGTRAGRPYVDFPVEFPVATAQVFRTLAPIAGNRHRFGVALVIGSVVADLVIVGALAWGWGVEAAACYALVAIPLLDLFLLRMDLWSTALATIAVAAWRRGRPSLAAIGIAAGAAFKLWPLAFLPLLVVPLGNRRRVVGPIATAVVAGATVLCAWLWVAGPIGLYQVLTFRGARGWEVESTVGSLWMLFDQSTMRVETGAWRVGATVGPISILLFVLGAVPCLWMIWRGARTGHLGAGWAGGLSALLAMSALLSAQFAAWLAPAAGVAWVEKDRRVAVLDGMAVFLTNLVYKSFHPLLNHETRPLLTLLLRNAFLIGFAIYAGRLLASAAPLTASVAPAGDIPPLPAGVRPLGN